MTQRHPPSRHLWSSTGVRILLTLLLSSVLVNVVNHARLPEAVIDVQSTTFLLTTVPSNDPAPAAAAAERSRQEEPPDTQATERRRVEAESFWKVKQGVQEVKTDKHGNVVHHGVTKLDQAALQDVLGKHGAPSATSSNNNSNLTREKAREGRFELLRLLEDAGVQIDDPTIVAQLPTWAQVTALYGPEPVIVGLETCDLFRQTIPSSDASIGVAGLFNTGTNPLAMYLAANCQMPHNTQSNRGMRWQVPWGKHMLAERKWNSTAAHDGKVNKTNVLPVVLIRDPYSWMQSMCHHPYAAHWVHDSKRHCPNLVPSSQHDYDLLAKRASRRHVMNASSSPSFRVTIDYPQRAAEFDSLADYWSAYYNQYYVPSDESSPRLMVRFEDLIFHPRQLLGTVCRCAGAVPKRDTFSYVVGEGKWGAAHAGSSNMISAMIKYGKASNRMRHLTPADWTYAQHHVDPHLLRLFRYAVPAMPTDTTPEGQSS